MKSTLSTFAVMLICSALFTIGCKHRNTARVIKHTEQKKLVDSIYISHSWRDVGEGAYLFDAPSSEQIERWKKLCEDLNPPFYTQDTSIRSRFSSINQYITLLDIKYLWHGDDSHKEDSELSLWRLTQYDESLTHAQESEQDRFYHFKESLKRLSDFEPMTQCEESDKASLEADFQEFYVRVMTREAIRHSHPEISRALMKETKAWKEYHKQVISTYQIINDDLDSLCGFGWSMYISGIRNDNAKMREESLSDFYIALTDKKYPSSLERHRLFSERKVKKEYTQFIDSLCEEGHHRPLQERKEALIQEMETWENWMRCRAALSSRLTGLCKTAIDNSTNNIRRYKFIMLKNRYDNYGIVSRETFEQTIPYSISDEKLFTLVEN